MPNCSLPCTIAPLVRPFETSPHCRDRDVVFFYWNPVGPTFTPALTRRRGEDPYPKPELWRRCETPELSRGQLQGECTSPWQCLQSPTNCETRARCTATLSWRKAVGNKSNDILVRPVVIVGGKRWEDDSKGRLRVYMLVLSKSRTARSLAGSSKGPPVSHFTNNTPHNPLARNAIGILPSTTMPGNHNHDGERSLSPKVIHPSDRYQVDREDAWSRANRRAVLERDRAEERKRVMDKVDELFKDGEEKHIKEKGKGRGRE